MKAGQIIGQLRHITNAASAERAAARAKQARLEAEMIASARRQVTDHALREIISIADFAKLAGEYLIANLCMALALQTISQVGSDQFELVVEDSGSAYYDLLAVRSIGDADQRYLCIPWPLLNMGHTKFATKDDFLHYCACHGLSCYEDRYVGCKNASEWKADPEKLATAFGVACHDEEKADHDRMLLLFEGEASRMKALRILRSNLAYWIAEHLVRAKITIGSAPQWLTEESTHNGETTLIRKPAFDLLLQIMEDRKAVVRA